jgi:hypothetical protein
MGGGEGSFYALFEMRMEPELIMAVFLCFPWTEEIIIKQ